MVRDSTQYPGCHHKRKADQGGIAAKEGVSHNRHQSRMERSFRRPTCRKGTIVMTPRDCRGPSGLAVTENMGLAVTGNMGLARRAPSLRGLLAKGTGRSNPGVAWPASKPAVFQPRGCHGPSGLAVTENMGLAVTGNMGLAVTAVKGRPSSVVGGRSSPSSIHDRLSPFLPMDSKCAAFSA